MTENEIIEVLRGMQNPKEDYADLVGAESFARGHMYVYPEPEDYAIEEAITALKEIQQYREIGTVEECWEAAEKRKPKKCVEDSCHDHTHYKCPSCGRIQLSTYSRRFSRGRIAKHCENCGQALEAEDD